jgi:hypothetical protein
VIVHAPALATLEILKAAEKLLKRHGTAVRVEDVVAKARAANGTQPARRPICASPRASPWSSRSA